ncbi:MAG: bifunctional precorrin-2 dehydrogenase/sirohydrochlorin ferrochelatase [Bacteroidota bacterium]|nr:bifunctional precorrin-2 dehydrogenase/sirohydrochlorin ferrochelatase [Bacteroidota bacterium]
MGTTPAPKSQEREGNLLFPVFIKLENLKLLIVGGGAIGLEKLQAVLKNSPATPLVLVATWISDEVRELAAGYPNVKLVEKPYTVEDLEDKDLVIVATNDRSLSEVIKNDTKRKRILTNVADKPDLCDFYLGSVVKKGDLKIAISTNGKSPTLAKRIREFLENSLPESMQSVLDNLNQIRNQVEGDLSKKIEVLNEVTSQFLSKPKR